MECREERERETSCSSEIITPMMEWGRRKNGARAYASCWLALATEMPFILGEEEAAPRNFGVRLPPFLLLLLPSLANNAF